jgi:pyridine nucleotide-disulfide oxidoreductase family protein
VKQILLVGAGHAHTVVLKSFRHKPLHGARLMLVSPSAKQLYSGMLPGVVAGHYRLSEAQIDVARLAAAASVELVQASVAKLDVKRRTATLADGREIAYDILSLNAGSQVDTSIPGSAWHALAVKPLERFIGQLSLPTRIAVIGAGAAGAELAMALRYHGPEVTLYSGAASMPPQLERRVLRRLRRLGVDFRPGMAATTLVNGPVVVAGTARQSFDLVVLSTGPAPLPWLAHAGMATDDKGFLLVDSALRSVSHPEGFAAGDCATLRDSPHPKSGVYAVRQGELLADNLRLALQGAKPAAYQPQAKALLLLSCGARYAIAQRGGWSAEGRWVWWWKDRIDRRWIRDTSAGR